VSYRVCFCFGPGPLTHHNRASGKTSLVGVVSWGEGCAIAGKPGVYARITKVMCWLSQHVDDYTRNCNPAFNQDVCEGVNVDFPVDDTAENPWPECPWPLDYLGDGLCDDNYNNAKCGFDNGDCCLDSELFYCSTCLCYDNIQTGLTSKSVFILLADLLCRFNSANHVFKKKIQIFFREMFFSIWGMPAKFLGV
jgi:hypothetical protein